MEGRAIPHGLGGAKGLPKRKKREVEAAVEDLGAGLGGHALQQAVQPLEHGRGEATAIRLGGVGGRGNVAAAGAEEARERGRTPFHDP